MIQFSDQHLGGSFGPSQRVVYARPEDVPLFTPNKKRVNWGVALHILNFFRYHITTEHEATLYQVFATLAENEKPLPWSRHLGSIDDTVAPYYMSGHYHGAWGQLPPDDLLQVRGRKRALFGTPVTDDISSEGTSLDFSPVSPEPIANSPTARILRYLPPVPMGPAPTNNIGQKHLFTGHDDTIRDPFLLAGTLTSLPIVDHATEIPGWKRIAFVRRPGSSQSYLSRKALFEDGIDESCWCYEGLVVPGGGLMVGRWTHAYHALGIDGGEGLCGPFVFWRDWSV